MKYLLTALLALFITAETMALDKLMFEGREVHYSVPNGQGPFPLVLALHGRNGNGPQFERQAGFAELGEQEGFITVLPSAGSGKWEKSDIGFMVNLVRHMANIVPVNTNQIYVSGMSNGGVMSYWLACDASDVFAAAAPVAATLYRRDQCDPQPPVSVLAFNATDDTTTKYDGGWQTLGAEKSIAKFTTDCVLGFRNKFDRYAVTGYECNLGRSGLFTIFEGGHSWPGSDRSWSGSTPTKAVDATAEAWKFFDSLREVPPECR